MLDLKNYMNNLARSFNPFSYRKFSERVMREATRFFLTTIFLSVLLTGILSIPKIMLLEEQTDNLFSKMDILKADLKIATGEPIYIPEQEDPKVIIDTQDTVNRSESEFFMTKDFIYYDFGEKRKTLDEVTEITQYKDWISKTVTTFIILLAPALLVLMFLTYSVLLAAGIAIISIFMMLIFNKLLHKKATFSEFLKIGFFASVFIGLGIIIKPIFPQASKYFYFIFIIYYLLGSAMKLLSHKAKHEKKDHKEKR